MSGTNGRAHWREIRCAGKGCGRMLVRAYLKPGSRIEVRCPKCGRMNALEVQAGQVQQSALDTAGGECYNSGN